MKRLVYHPAAREEFKEAVAFYRFRSKRLANEFAKEFGAVTARLRELPFVGSPAAGDRRQALLKRFPYTVIYSVEADRIHVFAVKHHRREPSYWTDRT